VLEAALAAGDVACLQLRLKAAGANPADDGAIRRATAALLPITQKHDVAFILNDRPDLAITRPAA
jgi:thiamine-phosphate pyrophosphorylase